MKFPNLFTRWSHKPYDHEAQHDAVARLSQDSPPMPHNPNAPQPQETHTMTFLQHVGSIFKKILHIGEETAAIAEPFVAASFPEVLPIYASALGLATAAEASAATLTGTGPQKLAQVVANLTPQIEAWAKQNGIVWDNAAITKWTSALVDTLNLIPAPTVAPVPPPAAPVA